MTHISTILVKDKHKKKKTRKHHDIYIQYINKDKHKEKKTKHHDIYIQYTNKRQTQEKKQSIMTHISSILIKTNTRRKNKAS